MMANYQPVHSFFQALNHHWFHVFVLVCQSYQSVSSVTSVVSTLRLSSISLSTLFAELEAMMQPGLQDRKLLYRRHCDVAGHDAYGLNFPDGVFLVHPTNWNND